MNTSSETETKQTWEQKKNDYMREYMKQRYYSQLEKTREQSRIRSARYRQKHPKGINVEKRVNTLKDKIAVLKNELGEEKVKTMIDEIVQSV